MNSLINATMRSTGRTLSLVAAPVILLAATAAAAAVPGITAGAATDAAVTFNLSAMPAYITQPDGKMIYSWGYGCGVAPAAPLPGAAAVAWKPGFLPAAMGGAGCSTMQVPGPTLIVYDGQQVTVNLYNGLPAPAGNTSILFPGFAVGASGGTPGLLAQEAAPGATVSYTFTASSPGTRSYYSGTQGDLQIEMGLYGAIIVLPKTVPAACDDSSTGTLAGKNLVAEHTWGEKDFRLAKSAYAHPKTCYDREYLFQFSEMDPSVHLQADTQVTACGTTLGCTLSVATEPYHPGYFMINGRSMPDDMDPSYAPQYPHQPYNGNPHMHPGELTLLRIVGQGRWQHPFHEHGNHVRVLARDGNLILSSNNPADAAWNSLAGPLLFTTTTTPGQAIDGIFDWTGKGLNWDPYAHLPGLATSLSCTPDANGYNTGDPTAANYFEWCQDHYKPVESKPFGSVPAGGPVTLPDPNTFANGAWYGGSPYLGPDANGRAVGATPIPPFGTVANSPTGEAGFAFMWHSHNEREITTNNAFPGGMLMMMLVDSREFVIDESL
jgi:FtsP/CotA-like multicopper oxidase with cupredoxin domain